MNIVSKMRKPIVVKGDLPDHMLEEFSHCDELGLDCEMMGLNPYRDRLCLIQVGTVGGACALIQVDEAAGAPKLKSLLENEKIVKIFHYARMDCLFLKVRLKIETRNIFCTKLASRIARTYTDRHGLKEVVRDLIGDQMDKTNQCTDWGRPELTPSQLKYAEGDIKYLFQMKKVLVEIVDRENRRELLTKALEFLPTRIELDRFGYEDIFEH